jgi:hypothetical protein
MFLLETNIRKLELERQKEEARQKGLQDKERKTKEFHDRKMRDLDYKNQLSSDHEVKQQKLKEFFRKS